MADVFVSGAIDLTFYLGDTKYIGADPIQITFSVFGEPVTTKTVAVFQRLSFSVEAQINRVRPIDVSYTLTFDPELRISAPLPPLPTEDVECQKNFTTPFLDCERPVATYSPPQLKVGCKCPEDDES